MPTEQQEQQKNLVSVQVITRKRRKDDLYVEVSATGNFDCALMFEVLVKEVLIAGVEVRGFGPGLFFRTGHYIRDGHQIVVSIETDEGTQDAVASPW